MAVKLLHSTSKEHQEELRREAAILRRLRHPNIVNFLGLGSNGSDQVSSCGRPRLDILFFRLVPFHNSSINVWPISALSNRASVTLWPVSG